MTKLKPCPFCGEHPQTEEVKSFEGIPSYEIWCGNEECRVAVDVIEKTKEKAYAAWNKRVGDRK